MPAARRVIPPAFLPLFDVVAEVPDAAH